MIRPRKSIKTLSEAIKHGYTIAKERGIKLIRDGGMIRRNEKGEACEACALGMALIGVYGVKDAPRAGTYSALDKVFSPDKNECLPKTLTSKQKEKLKGVGIRTNDTLEFVYGLNDNTNLTPDKIAAKLEKCGL